MYFLVNVKKFLNIQIAINRNPNSKMFGKLYIFQKVVFPLKIFPNTYFLRNFRSISGTLAINLSRRDLLKVYKKLLKTRKHL